MNRYSFLKVKYKISKGKYKVRKQNYKYLNLKMYQILINSEENMKYKLKIYNVKFKKGLGVPKINLSG